MGRKSRMKRERRQRPMLDVNVGAAAEVAARAGVALEELDKLEPIVTPRADGQVDVHFPIPAHIPPEAAATLLAYVLHKRGIREGQISTEGRHLMTLGGGAGGA